MMNDKPDNPCVPRRKNPIEACVLCLARLGFGLARIERAARVNRNVARKWRIRAGLYNPAEGEARKQKLAGMARRRKQDAKFPLSLCVFSVPCRVEKITFPPRREEVESKREENASAARARAKAAYHADPAKHRAKAYAWLKSNPEKVRGYAKKYNKKAKAKDPERFRRYRRKQRAKPYNRVVSNLRGRLREIVKRKGGKVTSRLTGCSADVLKLHLQSKFKRGMRWNNYGTAWVVDHIVPCASFDLTDAGQQQACFHFSNLQPLFAQVNADKSDTVHPCQPELVIVL